MGAWPGYKSTLIQPKTLHFAKFAFVIFIWEFHNNNLLTFRTPVKELLDVICTFTCALLCKTSLLFLLFLVAGGGSAYIPTFILRHFPPELSVLFTWLQILNCYTTKSTTSEREREIHIRQMYTTLWHGTQLLLFTQLSPALNTFCMLKKFIFKYCGVKFYKEPPNRKWYRFHGMKKYCLYV